MSIKQPLNVGYFDPDTGAPLPLRVEVRAARQAILRAGGRLPEQAVPGDEQRLGIAATMKALAGREVLGFVGDEFVVLHEGGFLMTTIGYGPHGPMLAFLRCLCEEHGCQVYSADAGEVVTRETLAWLTSRADGGNA